MEENIQELIQEAVEAAGVIAELDQNIENELINLANNPQVRRPVASSPLQVLALAPPLPAEGGAPLLLLEPPEHSAQLQEFASSVAQVATLFTTYNKVGVWPLPCGPLTHSAVPSSDRNISGAGL